ncbi:MAG: group I truncated hemoglobin [Egibacteraceae bacterium]
MQASIYGRIGGAPSVSAAVDLFYEKVWADPALQGHFAGIDRARLKSHQRAFVTAAVGGPQAYNGREMDKAHAGLGITDGAFDKVVAHLAASLTELGVDQACVAEITGALAPLRANIVEPIPAAETTVTEEARGLFSRILRRPRLKHPA